MPPTPVEVINKMKSISHFVLLSENKFFHVIVEYFPDPSLFFFWRADALSFRSLKYLGMIVHKIGNRSEQNIVLMGED